MPAFKDLSGQTFGRWRVVGLSHKAYGQVFFWNCVCACGTERQVSGTLMKTGQSTSCGCAALEQRTTHGHYGSKTYSVWAQMKARCTNPKHRNWHNYGGRGITICERWMTFENFLSDMGEKPDGLTIEREDNSKGYSPSNCKWATYRAQSANRRVTLMVDGRPLSDLAREAGISPKLAAFRHWSGHRDLAMLLSPVPLPRGRAAKRNSAS